MGCDGGTIPTRDEQVRLKKKPEVKDAEGERLCRWGQCALSQKALKAPVVACQLGRLYNKEAVICMLLNKTQEANNLQHIRGLKDVTELKLHRNPAYEGEERMLVGNPLQESRAPWSCPVTGLEMNGRHAFCYSLVCGCVVSRRALREVQQQRCLQCSKEVAREDMLVLNPDEEQLKAAKEAMAERKAKLKLAKKSAKRAAGEEGVAGPSEKKVKSSAAKPKPESKNKGASISGIASSILRGTEFDSVRSKEYSIAKNPEKSDVYKSIFDTHKSAQNKTKAHWVTCNPQYY